LPPDKDFASGATTGMSVWFLLTPTLQPFGRSSSVGWSLLASPSKRVLLPGHREPNARLVVQAA
jgi:hypothetical protein